MHNLLIRYWQSFRHAWQQRRKLDAPDLQRMEAEFLPAALALRDDPAPPAPRILMALLAVFALLALVWAWFGSIDIVATAHGKIVPDEYTKIVQPSESAVVKAIHVRDGQSVRAGDPLIDLDATIPQADAERVARELAAARLQSERARLLWQAIRSGQAPGQLERPQDATGGMLSDEQRLLLSQYQEFRSKLAGIDAEVARHRVELGTIAQTILKLEQTAPLAEQRARDYRDLTDRNFMSRHAWLEKEQASIELRQDLETERARLQEVNAALAESERRRDALIAETARVALDARHEADLRIASLVQESIKAERKSRLMQLTAPVDGMVQQLAIHTVGGVVTPAQALLSVVPQDHPLRIEAWLPNKDIGFVKEAQSAEVKIETFNFTRYGTLPATIESVSRDAVQDEKLGLVYLARIKLAAATMEIDDRRVNLSPGMAVTVEIKTGKRRVIEYFLSPLIQYRKDSLRER